MKPPQEIDGAKVLLWAWSGAAPFGFVGFGKAATTIHGLAICQYAGAVEFYRLSCDANWETQQDQVYSSIQEAIEELPEQYRKVEANWIETA